MRKAKHLRPGDVIGLIAPASKPQVHEKITESVRYFESVGYRVALGKNIEKEHGYLAGTDRERVNDIHAMFADKNVKAIFFLRGGYGSIRLLPHLDYSLIKKNPKIIVGYSDATSLFNAIYHKTGLLSCFYGPMPGVDIWDGIDAFAEGCMWHALTSPHPIGELSMDKHDDILMHAKKYAPVEGKLIGGNLTVFSSSMGTPYLTSLGGKILFFEDVAESPYRIDRYLAQLNASGALEKAKAILLGQFTDCIEEDKTKLTLTTEEVFKDYFSKLNIPILKNLPSGHIKRQWTIPLGAKYRIDGRKISVIESVLE